MQAEDHADQVSYLGADRADGKGVPGVCSAAATESATLSVAAREWQRAIPDSQHMQNLSFQARFPSASPVRFTSSRSEAYNRAYFVSFKAKTGVFSVGVK